MFGLERKKNISTFAFPYGLWLKHLRKKLSKDCFGAD